MSSHYLDGNDSCMSGSFVAFLGLVNFAMIKSSSTKDLLPQTHFAFVLMSSSPSTRKAVSYGSLVGNVKFACLPHLADAATLQRNSISSLSPFTLSSVPSFDSGLSKPKSGRLADYRLLLQSPAPTSSGTRAKTRLSMCSDWRQERKNVGRTKQINNSTYFATIKSDFSFFNMYFPG